MLVSHRWRVAGGRYAFGSVLLILLVYPRTGLAQDDAPSIGENTGARVQWSLIVDGEAQPGLHDTSFDEGAQPMVERALQQLSYEGFPYAQLDSVRLDMAGSRRGRIYLSRGAAVAVKAVHVDGVTVLDSLDLLAGMETRRGRPFSPRQLEADIEWILQRYERAGYPLATIHVDQADVATGDPHRVAVRLRVQEGPRAVLKGIELQGAERTKAGYVAQIAGLQIGVPLVNYEPEQIRDRLLETGLFRSVEMPELRIEPDSAAVLVLELAEASPGVFDLALGYQPPGGGSSGRLVGNGHLELRNIFGGGRSAAVQLSRLPGQVSSVSASFADPFLAGLPVGVELAFEGLQDSTRYGKQRYLAALTYRFGARIEAAASLSRERTRPGREGVKLQGGRQRIPRAQAWFGGIGVRYRNLDVLRNPRRGVWFDLSFERGIKDQSVRLAAAGDTTVARSRVGQERFTGQARVYMPTWPRQVLVLGADARLLGSDTYDPSDLFRFGGANTLRGYDEDRFLGRFVGRTVTEYRYLLDRLSYAFAFLDVGYVEAPDAVGRGFLRGVYPGFGFGIQYDTPIGLVNTSYAMNREGGRISGRVHVGLSFGL